MHKTSVNTTNGRGVKPVLPSEASLEVFSHSLASFVRAESFETTLEHLIGVQDTYHVSKGLACLLNIFAVKWYDSRTTIDLTKLQVQ